jgi:hypothetical protein
MSGQKSKPQAKIKPKSGRFKPKSGRFKPKKWQRHLPMMAASRLVPYAFCQSSRANGGRPPGPKIKVNKTKK